MKSKSPSAASAKSTPSSSLASRSGASLLALLTLPLFFAACYVPPGPKPATEPPAESYAEREAREVKLSLTTPSGGWSLALAHAYRLESGTALVWQLTPPDGPAIAMISEVKAQAKVEGATPPLRHYVLGKTWKWDSNPEVAFVDSLDELKDALAEAEPLPFTTD